MFVMNENYQDFDHVCWFAEEQGIPFKYDSMIIAAGNTEEKTHQITDECMIDLVEKNRISAAKYNEETQRVIMGSCDRKLFLCGAGRSSCWLKSSNCLRICNFLNHIEFDMTRYKVKEAWAMMLPYIESEISESGECGNCSYRSYCDYCPAKSYTVYDRTDMETHPDIYCKVAKMRACNQCYKE